MEINNQITIIAETKTATILKIIKILNDWHNLSMEKLANLTNEQMKYYVKLILNRVKVDQYKLDELKAEIEERGRILEEFRRAYVQGDSYDDVHLTGGANKPADARAIKMIKMREEQADRIIEYDLVEKRIKEKHQDIEEFIDLLPNPRFAEVMKLTYFHGLSNVKIANKLTNMPIQYVDTARFRSIQQLANLIKKVVRGAN